jgi:hypothetical protein
VVTLAQTTYQGCNYQHLSAVLAEREGLVRSRSRVRRMLREAGLATPEHLVVAARPRRPRSRQAGRLVQIDARPHAWLAGRGPSLVRLAAIDDATHELPAALFRATEDAHGDFRLLERLVRTHGRPLALDHDRQGIFQGKPKQARRLEEQLAGRPAPTHFGRLLAARESTSIAAQSPQARLVGEVRLAGAATLAAADQALAAYLPRVHARFRGPATEAGSAYRPLATGLRPETLCCCTDRRTVAPDNTVRFGEQRRPRRPGPALRSGLDLGKRIRRPP